MLLTCGENLFTTFHWDAKGTPTDTVYQVNIHGGPFPNCTHEIGCTYYNTQHNYNVTTNKYTTNKQLNLEALDLSFYEGI